MSMRSRLSRARRLTRAEAAWRTRATAQRAADRVALKFGARGWRRESLARALTPAALPGIQRLLATSRFETAHQAIAAHVRQRPVRSLLHPSLRDGLRASVLRNGTTATADAQVRGDRIVRGEYDLLGYERLRFPTARDDSSIDWHLDAVSGGRAPLVFWADVPYLSPRSGDHKVIWELNRHQHWLILGRAWWLSGDPRYRNRLITEAGSWMAANPPYFGINWASALELAFRAIAWTWAIELFAEGDVPGEPPWLVDLLLGLDVQMRHIERNLSWYFSPNTHLLGEGLALYVCGRTWPEFRDSGRWARVGGDILTGEINRQVLQDGFHAERSTHYHRYALDFYLLALATARLTGDHRREGTLASVADRMAVALRQVTDAGGRVPLVGDDDGGELFPIAGHAPDDVRATLAWAASLLGRQELAIGQAPEAVQWLTAALPATPAAAAASPASAGSTCTQSAMLASSGYYVSRRNDSLLLFDAGAHGFMNAGHAHADSLAVTLSAGPHRLLIDPGTGTYTMSPALRDRLRSSQLHNTVTVDGRSQSAPAGPFHWSVTAQATVERAVVAPTFDLFHAATDAYEPVRHERMVFATGAHAWIIADRLAGTGRHGASVHWHIDPEWAVAGQEHGAWVMRHRAGLEARLAMPGVATDLFRGDAKTGLGWVAPIYGRLTPATTLRGTSERNVPFWMVTTLDIGLRQLHEATTSLLDVVSSEAGGSACAVLTRHARGAEVTMFRAGRERDTLTVGVEPRGGIALTTDAAALHARISNRGRLERVCLVDATFFRLDGPASVTIASATPVPDLDVRVESGAAPVVTTTRPCSDLTISLERPSTRGAGGNATSVAQSVLQ
jgi:hypothetical protein